MAEEIQRGVIAVDGDASGFNAALAEAGKAVDQFQQKTEKGAKGASAAVARTGEGGQQAADKMSVATRRFIASLERQSLAAGRTRSEYLELRAAQMGISEQAAPFVARIRQAENSVGSLAMSAKQTTQAMRLLPAQITDIVTGLVSGQPAYLVAIQQGGQLKDSFGGIVPAARALASVFTPLRIALGLVGGSIAALVFAYAQGAKETGEFNKAIALSGNVAGVTAGRLNDMARSIASVYGTQAGAADVLARLTASGDVAADAMERIGVAISRFSRASGREVQELVDEFARLGDDPVKASEQLNDRYNHLTLRIYEQIRALEDAGRTAEAAHLAQTALADAQIERTTELESRLGYIERAWRGIKGAVAEVWDSMKDLGREESPAEAVERIQAKILGLQSPNRGGAERNAERIAALHEELRVVRLQAEEEEKKAAEKARQIALQQEAIKASKANAEADRLALTNAQKANEEIERYLANVKKIRDAGGAVDDSQIQRTVAAIRERYRDRTQVRETAAERMLDDLRKAEASLIAQLETEEKLGAAARKRVEFEAMIAGLKEKTTLTADQKSILANQDIIRLYLEGNEAIEARIQLRDQERKKVEELRKAEEAFGERIKQIRSQMEASREGRQDQYDRQIGAFGMGRREQERVASQAAIFREFQRLQAQLARATPEHMLGSDAHMQEVARIKQGLDEALRDHERYYERLRELESDWSLGAQSGLRDYLDTVENTAASASRFMSDAFTRAEDALVDFVMTGKGGFRSLTNFIIAEINRMTLRQYVLGPIAQFLGGAFGGLGYGTAGAAAATAMVPTGAGGFVPALADGGSAIAGRLHLVGERGPELFVPKTDGTVIPNHRLGGGPSVTVNQSITIDSRSDQATILAAMNQAKEMAKAEIHQAIRSGSPAY